MDKEEFRKQASDLKLFIVKHAKVGYESQYNRDTGLKGEHSLS